MMKTLSVKRVMSPDEATKLVGTMVEDAPVVLDASEPFIAVDEETGEPLAIYIRTPGNRAAFRDAVRGLKWSATRRGQMGFANTSRIFGYIPRKPLQSREGCTASALAYEAPEAHAVVTNLAADLATTLDGLLPDAVENLYQTEVLNEWRITDSPWTSGVINKTSQLPYHRDASNWDGWSAMPAVRRGTRGGNLHIPEYNLVLPVRDGWTLYFNGFRLVHGVTPIEKITDDGYRITAVFYCLRGMKDCHTFAVETQYAAKKRAEREAAFEENRQKLKENLK